MTVESSMYDLLKGFVSNRVYPDVAPLGVTHPYITFQQVGGYALSYFGREIPSKKHGRFQVNVWADTRLAAAALALQVEGAFLTATAFQSEPIGAPVAQYDEDTKTYGSMQDFGIWSDR